MRSTLMLTLTLLAATFASGCATASKAHLRKMQAEGEALRLELAETYVQKGAYDAAVPLLRRAIAARPDDFVAHTLYGIVLRERRLYPQAEGALRRALTIEPGYARAWDALGVLYDLWHRPDEALAAHRRAVELSPGTAAFWNNLGFSLYASARYADAVLALEQALLLDPSLVQAYNNLGFSYGALGDLKNAERCFRSGGDESAALYNLAIVREQRGEVAEAAALYERAVALDPALDGDDAAGRPEVN